MNAYTLHYFPESGNSYKLALMLTLCGQAFEPVWTDFNAGVTRTPEWRRDVNPMGEIPVLLEDGVSLTQTAPILLRLAARYGRFEGRTEAERFEVLRWLFWDNQKLTGFMAAYRFRRAFTRDADPAVLGYMKARIDDFLSVLEVSLAQRPFIVGDHPTVADLSMTGYLVFPKHESGYDLDATHPSIAAWLVRIRTIPGWVAPYDILPGRRMPSYV